MGWTTLTTTKTRYSSALPNARLYHPLHRFLSLFFCFLFPAAHFPVLFLLNQCLPTRPFLPPPSRPRELRSLPPSPIKMPLFLPHQRPISQQSKEKSKKLTCSSRRSRFAPSSATPIILTSKYAALSPVYLDLCSQIYRSASPLLCMDPLVRLSFHQRPKSSPDAHDRLPSNSYPCDACRPCCSGMDGRHQTRDQL